MINAFQFAQMPAIEFGWGITQTQLPDAILKATQKRILLVCSHYVNQHFVAQRFEQVMAQRDVHRVEVSGEPTTTLIDQ